MTDWWEEETKKGFMDQPYFGHAKETPIRWRGGKGEGDRKKST